MIEAFGGGMEQLRQLGRGRRAAIMCAEAVWWRCHRRIIADYLLALGREVLHLMAPAKLVPATLTPGAVAGKEGAVRYPAAA